jgi:hypothetical protein
VRNDPLRDLVGQRVKLWSVAGNNEHSDQGTLEGIDNGWLRLRSDDGGLLCFSVGLVRLVKPISK